MRYTKTYMLTFCLVVAAFIETSHAVDFFKIQSIKFVDKPPRQGITLYRDIAPGITNEQVFTPFLEVQVRTKERVKADTLYAKAYYYDRFGKALAQTDHPHPVERGTRTPHQMPVFFAGNQPETLYFAVPQTVLETREWRAVALFGDKYAAAAKVHPPGAVAAFDFPERSLVDNPERIERKAAMDPVVEHVVKTRNEKQPQITLFMRPPIGMTDATNANGVLAMCLLAGNVGEIKRRLQEADAADEVGGILRFAERHKLVILCWGARSLWNPRASWDEQSKLINKQMDETFDDVATAWSKGVGELSNKYGIPDRDFLLWGMSGSAQYAARLALRQPQYFLAIHVHVHVPSSFDQPTLDANRVLWCLTTGENEPGYKRSLRFFAACHDLGYPIVYKAIIGLGHAGHPQADRLGLEFFEYALSLRGAKASFEADLLDNFSESRREWMKNPCRPWPKTFQTPEFAGDVVNQTICPFKKVEMIPANFRTMLPTRKLAETWLGEK